MRRTTASDLEGVGSWHKARGLVAPEALPVFGFIEPDVAAGFLVRTELPMLGFLNGFVSAPGAPRRKVAKAMVAIEEQLREAAALLGIRYLALYTQSTGIEKVATGRGYKNMGFFVGFCREV